MGRGIVTIALLSPFAVFVGSGQDSDGAKVSQDRPSYRLEATSEVVQGFRSTDRTVYTYFWTFKGQERELWRVALDEKYEKHWIDRQGNVWVLSSGGVHGVRPGTFGDAKPMPNKLWIRDTAARELGFLNLPQAQYQIARPSGAEQPWGQPDIEEAKLTEITSFKTRFVLPHNNNTELHVYRIFDNDHGYRCLATWTKTGEQNQLDKVIEATSPIETTNPVSGRKDIELWSSSPGGSDGALVYFAGPPITGPEPIRTAQFVSGPISPPSYVTVTPNNKILWFDFGGYSRNVAHLDVLDHSARLVGRIDFVKNGMFENAYKAEQALDYTRLSIKRGTWWPYIERVERDSSSTPEIVGFGDSANRWYEVTIPSYSDKNGEVTVQRALASVKDLKKEPDYVGFQRTGERIWKSQDGTFAYRVRRFKNDAGRELAQQTFLRYLKNGLEHEYWSKNLYAEVIDALVTDEGRTLVMTSGEIKNVNTDKMEPFVHLETWNYSGQGYAVNLGDARFFGSLQVARSANLSQMTVEYEGDMRKIEFEGEDLLVHPVEVFTWSMNGTKVVKFSLTTLMPNGYPSMRIIK